MILTIISLVLLALAVIFIIWSLVALKRRKIAKAMSRLLFACVLFLLSITCGLGFFAVRGYRAFTYETLAATITIQPVKEKEFYAHVTFVNGEKHSFLLEGDELYLDAHILKWKPFANFIGVHTAYQLNRISGRYTSLEDEQLKDRTVFALSKESVLDMFHLRRKFSQFSFLVDADYGSASFVPAQKEKKYALMVSISGLLIRELD